MRIIFSRKGFDSSSGGAPSPIYANKLISIPIPTSRRSVTNYADIGLGELVESQTGHRITSHSLCHADPLFHGGQCAFGQTGSAQCHLYKKNVSVGDVFLFFGLFQKPGGRREHWIYAYMKIEQIIRLGSAPISAQSPAWAPYQHPHTIGDWNDNNTLYLGEGTTASTADKLLKLTADGESTSIWSVPPWLKTCGLSYHGQRERWLDGDKLRVVGRGQEFVSDIQELPVAKKWVKSLVEVVSS